MCEQNLKRKAAVILSLCMAVSGVSLVLGGCTRREQLVLETADMADESRGGEPGMSGRSSDGEAAGTDSGRGQEQPESGQQAGQGQAQTGIGQQPGQGQSGTAGDEAAKAGQYGADADGSAQTVGGEQPADSTVIWVHVCGAVRKAGVYELPAGSRVFEAVQEAGGFAADADESYVNQAQRLSDGAKLVIPTVEQVEEAAGDSRTEAGRIGIVEQAGVQEAGYGVSAAGTGDSDGRTDPVSVSADGRININTAPEAQLCEIPGIGATRAAAIAAYRQEHGGFSSIEEIMNVSGIKEGTYAKIKDRITVN
ncbi:MAG: hypothetical protein HFI58_10670 [Lachnospiraceae bacterium]|jgi:competence protein ComEA|nr:hypothetical protein [Lachnospiraceae bacterium]MCI8985724.1 hypothetical protein [Lachnospiraceae bacterium]MCI9014220.1 hypothetical protein [Lachnospiraceae bacterium]MCI9255261.1 hypothetical protein [Lachnospiraceae bacterium]